MNTKYLLAILVLAAFGCSELESTQPEPGEVQWSGLSEEEPAESDADPRESQQNAKDDSGEDETPSDEKADTIANPAQFEAEVIEWVNEVRASGADCGEHGSFPPAGPMRLNPHLRAAAQAHSADMAEHDMMAHEGTDGSRFWDRAETAGYRGTARGENVAVGYPNPEEVVRAWLESDGHCMVIMLPETNEMGAGYKFRDNTRYGHFWTMNTGIR